MVDLHTCVTVADMVHVTVRTITYIYHEMFSRFDDLLLNTEDLYIYIACICIYIYSIYSDSITPTRIHIHIYIYIYTHIIDHNYML